MGYHTLMDQVACMSNHINPMPYGKNKYENIKSTTTCYKFTQLILETPESLHYDCALPLYTNKLKTFFRQKYTVDMYIVG